MLEDFELSGTAIVVTLAFWLLVIAGVWKFQIGDVSVANKVLMTVASLPIIFFVVNWQLSR